MLVLSRKMGESIEVDGGIVVRVLSIQQDTVRLGITAPAEVAIVRPDAVKKKRPIRPAEELVYLACPYTDPDPQVERARFAAASVWAAELFRSGLLVFSPLSHSHPLIETGLGGDWETWGPLSLAMLTRCTRMVVLMLPGWERSVGISHEIDLAKRLGRPIEYLDPEGDLAAQGFGVVDDEAA